MWSGPTEESRRPGWGGLPNSEPTLRLWLALNPSGSKGEHELQERFGTKNRAYAFYDNQMLDHLNPLMSDIIAQQGMVFIATADSHGESDSSFRGGLPGFVQVLNDRTLLYPEYRGNGILASLGNISENPHVGMFFVDFFNSIPFRDHRQT